MISKRALALSISICVGCFGAVYWMAAPPPAAAQQVEVPASDFEEDDAPSNMQSAPTAETPADSVTDGAPQVSTDWRTYTDPTGSFSLQVPPGWNVACDRTTGRIDVGVVGGPGMSVLPFFLPGKELSSAEAALFFVLMMKQSAPNATWAAPTAVSGTAMKANYTTNTESGTAAMAFASGTPGTVGRVILSRVPFSSTGFSPDTFGRVLNSLKFASTPPAAFTQERAGSAGGSDGDVESGDGDGGGGGTEGGGGMQGGGQSPLGPITYEKFVDPNQNSFSIDVPVGWKASGGMVRPIAIDPRPWVKVVSPDDLCTIFLGDPSIAPATMPTPLLYKLGFREGSNYNTGYGLKSIILSYQPATKFVQKYGNMVLNRFASGISCERVEDHPDIARALNGNAQMSSAASAKFTGMYGSTPMVAYFLASTKGQWVSGTGSWWVTMIGGVVTTPDRDQAAIDIFLHMWRSFAYNPSWTSNAIQQAGETSRIVSQTSDSIFRSMSNSYWNRQRAQERAANNFSNYIRGTQDLQDPTTGKVYNVEYGPRYHWINSGGQILGTDSNEIPGVDWSQMTAVPGGR